MTTAFNNKPLKWDKSGTEPTNDLKVNGWKAGYKPPAEYFNYKFNSDYKVMNEIQEKITAHNDSHNNPHNITKSQIGLGNVDNTSDINKPISSATQNALNNKADKTIANLSKDGLMSAADKTKLNNIAENANNYSHPTSSGNKHIPSGGEANQILTWEANGTAQWSNQNLGYVNGLRLNGTSTTALTNYGLCETSADETEKQVNINNYSEYTGAIVFVKFKYTNTAASPKLRISKFTSHLISSAYGNAQLKLIADIVYCFIYDGVYWQLLNDGVGINANSIPFKNSDGGITKGSNGSVIFNDFTVRDYDEQKKVKSGNVATGARSTAHGFGTTASGSDSFSAGHMTTASGWCSFSTGWETEASGDSAFSCGIGTKAIGKQSFSTGNNTISKNYYSFSCGQYNNPDTNGYFMVGIGTSSTVRANGFRVGTNGTCYVNSAINTSGADYAEYFEWLDGNNENEDRLGKFVTLDGEKIRIANDTDSFILGVVSATPSVCGDTQSELWKDMYLTDIFGRPLYKEVKTTDNDGKASIQKIFIINPNYDHTKKYIAREFRKEWESIGLIGKLIVIDDGSCIPNEYCFVSENGIATKSDNGYRVMKRLDKNHIKILFR